MTSWLKKFKEVIYDEKIFNKTFTPLEILKYPQESVIAQPIPQPIAEPIAYSIPHYIRDSISDPIPNYIHESTSGPIPNYIHQSVAKSIPQTILEPLACSESSAPLPIYEGTVRPGTASTENYNSGVQLIKYRKYHTPLNTEYGI